ncbi:hypothetical protein HJFPF1_07304 [Paramyrothecium foliicola]|nr:hypothetical protein HJFPF1_07304 [Paramyrothecium foliicola]
MASVLQATAPTKEIKEFLTEFYRLSDTPEEHEAWINSFTSDAFIQIGAQKAEGAAEIRKLRGWMWEVLKESKHTVSKIFLSSEAGEPEIAIFGNGRFSLTSGADIDGTFAGHVAFRRLGDELKIAIYNIYNQNQ